MTYVSTLKSGNKKVSQVQNNVLTFLLIHAIFVNQNVTAARRKREILYRFHIEKQSTYRQRVLK